MYSGHMTQPVEVILKDGSLNAGESCLRENLIVGDAVLTTVVKDSSKLCLLEALKTFDFPMIQSSCLSSIQKSGEDHGPKDYGFGSYGKAMFVEDPVSECFICILLRSLLQVTLFDDTAMIG